MRPSSFALVGLVKLLVGAYPRWVGCAPDRVQRIYFANHTSHIDTMAIWAALPIRIRGSTRPVAARDYWGSGIRRYFATKALRAVLIDRARSDPNANPLAPLIEALQQGDSLIIFPEGTRGTSATPAAFKSGLYHLATQFSGVQLVPVYLENPPPQSAQGRGAADPDDLHGPLRRADRTRCGEAKDSFLERARAEVIKLAGNLNT